MEKTVKGEVELTHIQWRRIGGESYDNSKGPRLTGVNTNLK